MGRRRKRDQDFDGSLEADYVLQRRGEVQGQDDDDEAADDNDTTAAVDQVERNRRKKARRKERQKEKAQERKEATAAAADQAKSARDEKSLAPAVKTERPASIAWSSMARGVQYHDMVIGQGPVVQDRQTVRVKYKLRADNVHKGKVIDSSQNFGFRLGKGEVIKGWDIGMAGMKVGGRRLLMIPPKAGYGLGRDVGAGKGGILYFDVTVIR
jgi:FKBP-type peptidyl-prolyl cis-trans isomerase